MKTVVWAVLKAAYWGSMVAGLLWQWTMSATLFTFVVLGLTPKMVQIPGMWNRIFAILGCYSLAALLWWCAVMVHKKERNG